MGEVLGLKLLIWIAEHFPTMIFAWLRSEYRGLIQRNVKDHVTIGEPSFHADMEITGTILVTIPVENHSAARIELRAVEGTIAHGKFPVAELPTRAGQPIPLGTKPDNRKWNVTLRVVPSDLFWTQDAPIKLTILEGRIVVSGGFGSVSLPIHGGIFPLEGYEAISSEMCDRLGNRKAIQALVRRVASSGQGL